ncbi:uncharacterized protein LOC119321243 [Triticum dicoccoides]|uniref:uncharacterized protein LOC119321243 n=1 Tax=Triticum dicoccoides TaxID=85692 RepID=UPI0018915AA8|nr:uncharacterized protein LOC119321243 [Triticum dicoccoides]XP_044415093.1 uncharacterized protein LOC123139349 [Triticum aestivum]
MPSMSAKKATGSARNHLSCRVLLARLLTLLSTNAAAKILVVGLPNVGKSTFFNIVTKVGSRAGNSRLAVKKIKAEKDPNKPTRPRALSSSSCESQSWFLVRFVLLLWDNFRKDYKEKHLGVKQVSVIGKVGGEKWKSMSDVLENEKHAGALLLHTSGTISGAVVLLEATGVMAALYGGDHKLSIYSICLLCDGLQLFYGDVDILSDLKLLIFFVLIFLWCEEICE